MKSRQVTPQPELLRMRTFKLETAPEPQTVQINELFTPTMSLNGYGNVPSDPDSPIRQNGSDSIPQKTPPRPPSYLDASPSEANNHPWSAAIGRATNGKSGRVIERLMGDNDRLKREMTLSNAKLDEETKRSESARSALESLRASNENLQVMHDTHSTILSRKDRKIEELRAELESEKSKRESAEAETKNIVTERDDIIEKLTAESTADKLLAKKSSSQYELLVKSWKTVEVRYEKQIQELTQSARTLRDQQEADRKKIGHMDVITDQLQLEIARSQRLNQTMAGEFDAYKQEQGDQIQRQEAEIMAMRERAIQNDAETQKIVADAAAVVGEMKYVMNLKKNMKSSD